MANPYIVGDRVPSSQLYGRRELIQECYEDDKNNVWLLGKQRSGKTSILHAIEESALKDKEWLPVYIDMSGCFSGGDVKNAFLKAFRTNLKGFDTVRNCSFPDEVYDFAGLVSGVCGQLNENKIGLLLLLDEIEQLEKEEFEEGSKLVSQLRDIHEISKLCLRTIVAASSLPRQQKEMLTSPFVESGLFDIKFIGGISKADAIKLIKQRGKIQVDDKTVNKIIEVTGCEPYLIQYLCSRLYSEIDNILRMPTDEDLTLDDFLRETFFDSDRYLTIEEKEILHTIAQGEKIVSVPGGIVNLFNLGYVKRINGQYKIGNSFLAAWLRQSVVCKIYDNNNKVIRTEDAKVTYDQAKKEKSYIKEIGIPNRLTKSRPRPIAPAVVLSRKTPLLKVEYGWSKAITVLGPNILPRRKRNTFYWKNEKRKKQPYNCNFQGNQETEESLFLQIYEVKASKWPLRTSWIVAILFSILWCTVSLLGILGKIHIGIEMFGIISISIPLSLILAAFQYTKMRPAIEAARALKQEEKITLHSQIVSREAVIEVS
ncbi:hypothetical protein FJZ31_21750 [Candidatus Poribacteria bacterium]|nr:hypothetical protein [Candidatus Poribacteria bacterium]